MSTPPVQPVPASNFESGCAAIATRLVERGWCVTPDFLPAAQVDAARAALQRHWQQGDFRAAGVGRGDNLQLKPSVRTDQVCWLDTQHCDPAFRHYLEMLEVLRATLNRTLFMGLFEFEAHLAVYPPGSFYRKHLDQFRDVGSRVLSCILYLNENWQGGEGGQLRIYTDSRDERHYEEIQPRGGQLVTFLSTRFLHEVLPASRPRMSITGWFRTRT